MKMRTHQQRVDDRLESVPQMYRQLYFKTISGEASPRQAIKSMCLACVGHIRKEVTLCTDSACSLYKYRPYASDKTPQNEALEAVELANDTPTEQRGA